MVRPFAQLTEYIPQKFVLIRAGESAVDILIAAAGEHLEAVRQLDLVLHIGADVIGILLASIERA